MELLPPPMLHPKVFLYLGVAIFLPSCLAAGIGLGLVSVGVVRPAAILLFLGSFGVLCTGVLWTSLRHRSEVTGTWRWYFNGAVVFAFDGCLFVLIVAAPAAAESNGDASLVSALGLVGLLVWLVTVSQYFVRWGYRTVRSA